VRLVLLRHATAIARGAPGFDDRDRPLTSDGERESRLAGRALKRSGVRPGAVISSPYERARATARIAAAELRSDVVEDDRLEPGFGRADLDALLAHHPASCLVLVGHDPDFSDLLHQISGVSCSMAKGGAARVDVAVPMRPGQHELRWLLRPRQIALMAGEGA